MRYVVIVVALLAVAGDAMHDMSTITDLHMLGATKQDRQSKGVCHIDNINKLKRDNVKLEDQPYCVLVPLPAKLKKWPHSMFLVTVALNKCMFSTLLICINRTTAQQSLFGLIPTKCYCSMRVLLSTMLL